MLKVPRPAPLKGVNRAGNWKSLAHASGSQITQSLRNQQGITHRSSDLLLPASALSNGSRAAPVGNSPLRKPRRFDGSTNRHPKESFC